MNKKSGFLAIETKNQKLSNSLPPFINSVNPITKLTPWVYPSIGEIVRNGFKDSVEGFLAHVETILRSFEVRAFGIGSVNVF